MADCLEPSGNGDRFRLVSLRQRRARLSAIPMAEHLDGHGLAARPALLPDTQPARGAKAQGADEVLRLLPAVDTVPGDRRRGRRIH